MTERRADEATWDVIGWLKCEYMSDKIGDVFKGIISGVTGFGLFVELKDIYVEGLVHVSSLTSDYYHFDEVRHRLVGEESGLAFALGDEVTVSVAKVDLDDRKLDFELLAGGKRARWSKENPKPESKSRRGKKEAGKGTGNGAGKGAGKNPKGGKKAGTQRHEVAKQATKKSRSKPKQGKKKKR